MSAASWGEVQKVSRERILEFNLEKSTPTDMRFRQLDAVTLLEPGERIEARKTVRGDEDYLKDHFPRFAVMPGVLMLEALFQASSMLVRSTIEHKAGLVLLRTAKNVKFADFVQPGQTLEITSTIIKREDNIFTLKASGAKAGVGAVSGRLVLEAKIDEKPNLEDQFCAQYMRQLTEQLQQAAVE